MPRRLPALLFLFVAEGALTHAQQLYVRPVDDSTLRNDCNRIEWPCTLQRAVIVAGDGDELLLSEGNYTAASGRIAVIQDSVTVTGGWDGVDRTPLNIDPQRYPSIIDGNNTTAGLRIEPQKNVTIRGVTFARCRSDENGSALYDFNATALHLVNDIFMDNVGDSSDDFLYGGAVFISGGTLDVNESNFTENAVYANASAYGGALYAVDTDGRIDNSGFARNSGWVGSAVNWDSKDGTAVSATISGSVFRANGVRIGHAISGYGTVAVNGTDITVSGSRFEDNFVNNQGAGAYLIGSAACKVVLENSRFSNNRNVSGSPSNNILQISYYGQATVYNNIFVGNTVDKDSNTSIVTFTHVDSSYNGTASFDDNTLSENNATDSVRIVSTSYIEMENNIFSDTTSAVYTETGSHVPVFYNNLDWNVVNRISGSGSVDDAQDNITGDPRFGNDGWHLQAGSAAINRGRCIALVREDIEGDARPFGSGCDIGADEFTGSGTSPALIMYLLN